MQLLQRAAALDASFNRQKDQLVMPARGGAWPSLSQCSQRARDLPNISVAGEGGLGTRTSDCSLQTPSFIQG